MKSCFKCGDSKPLDHFYRHKAMADGRLGKCIACTLSDVKKYRVKNIEKVRAYDRYRAGLPHRGVLTRRNQRSPRGRLIHNLASGAWSKRNAEKKRSHLLVRRALLAGRLQKSPCERCGETEGVEGHHEDYAMPLKVVWLCVMHHKQRHKEINEIKRQQLKKGTVTESSLRPFLTDSISARGLVPPRGDESPGDARCNLCRLG